MVNTRTTPLPAPSNTDSIKVTRRQRAIAPTTKGMDSEGEASNTGIASTSKGKGREGSTSKGKGREGSDTETHSISNSIRVKIEPEVDTHVLTVEVRGKPIPNANMDEDHDEVRSQFFLHFTRTNLWPLDQWCSACRNGGDFTCCDSCLRVICNKCVEFPKDASVFKCPFCHLRSDQTQKKRTPYKVRTVLFVFFFKGTQIALGRRSHSGIKGRRVDERIFPALRRWTACYRVYHFARISRRWALKTHIWTTGSLSQGECMLCSPRLQSWLWDWSTVLLRTSWFTGRPIRVRSTQEVSEKCICYHRWS